MCNIYQRYILPCLKSNAGKCSTITSSNSPVEFQIENILISNVIRVKFLDVHVEGRLDFDYHVCQICKKANKKLLTLSSLDI